MLLKTSPWKNGNYYYYSGNHPSKEEVTLAARNVSATHRKQLDYGTPDGLRSGPDAHENLIESSGSQLEECLLTEFGSYGLQLRYLSILLVIIYADLLR